MDEVVAPKLEILPSTAALPIERFGYVGLALYVECLNRGLIV